MAAAIKPSPLSARTSGALRQPLSQIKDFLTPSSQKEKLEPGLRNALNLLCLRDLEALENHFLALEAFQAPWAHYRDSHLLLNPQSAVRQLCEMNEVKGPDILWFYTNFDEGELRYDPRCDFSGSGMPLCVGGQSQYGAFDKTHWGAVEHEKLLFAWLLQSFRVGKRRNGYGFRYFEMKNVCTAWKEVFVPIVHAVRSAYDVRGRRFYGRLATAIEDRSPSGLAFPSSNVPALQTPTPYRVMTRRMSEHRSSDDTTGQVPRLLTEKDHAQVERELREVFPKYGQVIERPKFKTKMETWLAAQRERAARRNGMLSLRIPGKSSSEKEKGDDNSLDFGCIGISAFDEQASRGTSDPTHPTKNIRDSEILGIGQKLGKIRSKSQRGSSPKNLTPALVGISRQVPTPRASFEELKAPMTLKEMVRNDGDIVVDSQNLRDPGPSRSKPAINKSEMEVIQASSKQAILDMQEMEKKFRNVDVFSNQAEEVLSVQSDHLSSINPEPTRPQKREKHLKTAEEVFHKHESRQTQRQGRDSTYHKYADLISQSQINLAFSDSESHASHDFPRTTATTSLSPFHVEDREANGSPFPFDNLAPPSPLPWPGLTPIVEMYSKLPSTGLPPPFTLPGAQRRRSPHPNEIMRAQLQDDDLCDAGRLLGRKIVSKENIRAHLGFTPDLEDVELPELPVQVTVRAKPKKNLQAYNSHMFPKNRRMGEDGQRGSGG